MSSQSEGEKIKSKTQACIPVIKLQTPEISSRSLIHFGKRFFAHKRSSWEPCYFTGRLRFCIKGSALSGACFKASSASSIWLMVVWVVVTFYIWLWQTHIHTISTVQLEDQGSVLRIQRTECVWSEELSWPGKLKVWEAANSKCFLQQ